MQTQIKALPQYPTAWPRDNRSRVTYIEGVAILTHPERRHSPQQLDTENWKWTEAGKVT